MSGSQKGAPLRPLLLVSVLAFLALIVTSNNTAATLALPAIGERFGAGPADVGWVVFGFGTMFAIGTAVWGGLAGRLGIGRSLASGVLLFSTGSAVAAVAPSLPVLIAARVAQGFGAGAIPTLSATAIARQFDGPVRSRALGTVVAGVVLGIALGPLLGGVALEVVGWRGPVAFGIVAAPAVVLLYARGDRWRDPNAEIDLLGAMFVALGVAATTFTFNRLPIAGVAPSTLASLAILVAALALIAWRSDRPTTFVPRRLVTDPAFTRIVALGSVGMSAFVGTLVVVPVAMARAHGLTGLPLALVVLPLAICAAVVSLSIASVEKRLGRPRVTIVSLAALALGAAGTGLLGAEAPPVAIAASLIPIGVGFGLLQAPLVNELTIAFSDVDRPVAVGLYNLMFFLGGALGAAISTALVQRGLELPLLGGRPVAGFSTALLLLGLGPTIAAVLLIVRPGSEIQRSRGVAR